MLPLLALLALPAHATDTWTDVRDGVRLLYRTASGPLRIHVAEVDLCADGARVRATAEDERQRTVSSFAARVGAEVAINGDYFSYDDYTVSGLAIGDGDHWDSDNSSEAFAAFGGDHAWISPPAEVWTTPDAWMDDAVAGRPQLVEDGEPTGDYDDPSHCASLNPRSALGLSRDRQTLWLVVVDGRTSASVGVTCSELADVLDDLGAWTAFNLDGGGSSALWVDGGVVNDPSDGTERAVANHLAVVFESGAPAACDWSQDEVVLQAAEVDPHHTDVNGDGLADLCARSASDYRCTLATGDGTFGDTWTVPSLANTNGWADETNYQSIRLADIDGDRRADVCARGDAGVYCWKSTGTGFGASIAGPTLSDADGWDDPKYATTLQLADLDADGDDDLCARGATGLRCWPSTGSGFGAELATLALSDASGWGEPEHYGTIRLADIDGDGAADACARGGAGLYCWPSIGTGFGARFDGPAWSDAAGWDDVSAWSTIRLVDLDGDGRADVCGRGPDGVACARSTGAGFGAPFAGPTLTDASGWGDHDNYDTLRTGDVDADGDIDLCARANARVYCWLQDGDSFATRIDGPELSDTSGWIQARYYSTMRLADVTGDGRADLCARGSSGVRCWPSLGTSFATSVAGPAWSDDNGWDDIAYYSTLRLGTPPPVAESPGDTGDTDDTDVVDTDVPDTGAPDTDSAVDTDDTDGPGRASAIPGDEGCGCGVPGRASPVGVLAVLVALGLRRRPTRR
ncbi:MAG: phosphodiester glycosidase family protein [Myxococcota bacterium]